MRSELALPIRRLPPWALALLWLVLQAFALRYGRWLAIERSLELGDSGVMVLAAHRDLAKGLLFGTIALSILWMQYLIAAPDRQALLMHRPSWRIRWLQLLLFVALMALLWALPSPELVQWTLSWGMDRLRLGIALYALIALLWLALLASSALLLAPGAAWQRFAQTHRGGLLALLIGMFAYALSEALLASFESLWSNVFLLPTIQVAGVLGRAMGLELLPQLSAPFFGTQGFVIDIGPTCLGYQGVSIVLLVMLSRFYVDRHRLRFPHALAILPASVLILLLLNALRITLLVALGTHWSPAVALVGFHATSGWVELILTITGALYLIQHHRWFRQEDEEGSDDIGDVRQPSTQGAVDFWLYPLAVLMATAFVTQLLTGHFHWAYPVQVLVAAAFMLKFRARLPLLTMGWLWPPVCGLLVALAWVLLIPVDAQADQVFALQLFQAPTWAAVAWLACRLLGAALVVPMVEELAFRGYLWAWLQERIPAAVPARAHQWLTLAASAALFGLFHAHGLAATLAGLVFGGVYMRRGSLGDAVLAHAVTNAALGFYVLASGHWAYW